MKKTAIELFAGVGGFRVGLNNVKLINDSVKETNNFKFIWANQWEPSTTKQYAFECYKARFDVKNEDANLDISQVDKKSIPNHTLLCGGFPCQDYSVAQSLSNSKGIKGKKGVLWWQIRDILIAKNTPFVLLENVDRLTKSPAKQRGRDFGIILRCLSDLNYTVEWRVINAADYGFPQRRRRIYIFAYKNDTKFGKSIQLQKPIEILSKTGIFAKAFRINKINTVSSIDLKKFKNLFSVSNKFNFDFQNSGILIQGKIYTAKIIPSYKKPITLGDILINCKERQLFLTPKQIAKFKYLRGSKKLQRTKANGATYFYSEGSMSPFDGENLPGRTMLTSEGSVNRTSHIVKDPGIGKLRFLHPIECERLNQFPDNWTDTGMPFKKRYFMMGNALVCGIIKQIGLQINKIITKE